jgi:hypothetical protein
MEEEKKGGEKSYERNNRLIFFMPNYFSKLVYFKICSKSSHHILVKKILITFHIVSLHL